MKGITMEVKQEKLDIINKKFDEAKLDEYLIKNHEYLANLFSMVDEKTEWQYYNGGYPLKTHMNYGKMMLLASQFLGIYDKKYGYKLWKDYFCFHIVREDNFDFDQGKYTRNKDMREYLIRYPKYNNLSSLLVLVHEYIHHLSSRFPHILDDTDSYNVYCELLAILGELNCLDYLKNKGYQVSELETLRDNIRKRYQQDICAYLFTEPLLKRFLSGKTITLTYLDDLRAINEYYKMIGLKGIKQNINVLANNEISASLSYSYPLGLIWASSLHQDHISNEKFNNLIKNINILELDEFEKLLPEKRIDELAMSTVKEFDFKRKVI